MEYMYYLLIGLAIVALLGAATVYLHYVLGRKKEAERPALSIYQTDQESYLEVLKTISKVYVSIHVFDLGAGTCDIVKSTPHIDKYADTNADGKTQIRNVMANVTRSDFAKSMMEFVNLDTLDSRMKGKEYISQEFIGTLEGWCISLFIRLESDQNGHLKKVIHMVQNIDDAKKKELKYTNTLNQSLMDNNSIYLEMVNSASTGVIASDMDDNIVCINKAAANMFGYSDGKTTPENIYKLMDGIDVENLEQEKRNLSRVRAGGEKFEYKFTKLRKNGEKMYAVAKVQSTTLTDGRRILITAISDITRNKEIEDELTFISETDAMTEVNNRASGEKKISQMLSHGHGGMFCLLDVDRFKVINENYGYQVGDRVLAAVASALRESFKGSDTVLRMGGDEFAMFAMGNKSRMMCEKQIRELVDSITNIYLEGAEDLKIDVSIGVVFAKEGANNTFENLYRMADYAMRKCKGTKGESYKIYE